MKIFKPLLICCCLNILVTIVHAQTQVLDSLWNDPVIESYITKGIAKNRMGKFTLTVQSLKRSKLEIQVKQVSHEFKFGANAFMINGFDGPEKNQRFEKEFVSLFNLACIPFYWKTTEPVKGQLRFNDQSSFIYRRPAPDVVLDFCKRNNITPKGHTLIWNHPAHAVPEWLPKDTTEVSRLITNRIKLIGENYGSSIPTWDVVNETLHHFQGVSFPKDYAFNAFLDAQKFFPANTKLMINEVTSIWYDKQQEYSPYYLLIDNLLLRGAKIGAIGMQFHFFNEQLHNDVVNGKQMTPNQLLNTLDLYGRFKLPIHVSEITIPTLPFNEQGKEIQAKLTRNFYRLWFSHPAVEAIIWWNSVDGTALKTEDKWNGGLLNNDFSYKPSYSVLNQLINKEWKTGFKKSVSTNQLIPFNGYYGEYIIRIKQGSKIIEKKVSLHKASSTSLTIKI